MMIFSVIVVFSLAAQVLAADKPKSPDGIKFAAGTMKSLDAEAKTIVITTKDGDFSIVCDDSTMFASGSDGKALSDINEGDIVAAVYKEVEGKNVAKSITFKNITK
jgi:Cu/Ag efflux protein CusF